MTLVALGREPAGLTLTLVVGFPFTAGLALVAGQQWLTDVGALPRLVITDAGQVITWVSTAPGPDFGLARFTATTEQVAAVVALTRPRLVLAVADTVLAVGGGRHGVGVVIVGAGPA